MAISDILQKGYVQRKVQKLPRRQFNENQNIENRPPQKRNGDSYHVGNDSVFFDDSRTLVFTSSTTVAYPNLTSSTTQPYGLYTTANVVKGISDHIRPRPLFEEQFQPFKENFKYEQTGFEDEWFKTGSLLSDTDEDIPGPVWSREVVRIPLNLIVSRSAFNAGEMFDPTDASVLLYNKSTALFENVKTYAYAGYRFGMGDVTTGHQPPFDAAGRPTSRVFTNVTLDEGLPKIEQISGSVDMFTSLADPLESLKSIIDSDYQLLMSDYIANPFVVEKAIIELPMTTQPQWFLDRTRYVIFDWRYNGSVYVDFNGPAITLALINERSLDNKKYYDIIMSGTIIPSDDNELFLDELTVDITAPAPASNFSLQCIAGFPSTNATPALEVSTNQPDNSFTGSIKIKLNAADVTGYTAALMNDNGNVSDAGSGYHSVRKEYVIASASPYGRSKSGNQSCRAPFGKEFITPTVFNSASDVISNSSVAGSTDFNNLYYFKYKTQRSPYILYPNDKLTFLSYKGRTSLNTIEPGNTDAYPLTSYSLTGSQGYVGFFNNEDKYFQAHITLYGFELKQNKPYINNLNQRLTTDTIHGVIGDEIITDEFLPGLSSDFHKSYTDVYVTGSLSSTTTRGVVFNKSENLRTSNETFTGAAKYSDRYQPRSDFVNQQLFLSHVLQDITYYDSYPPNLYEIYTLNGGIPEQNQIFDFYVDQDSVPGYSDHTTLQTFPFCPEYSSLSRELTSNYTRFNNRVISPVIRISTASISLDTDAIELEDNVNGSQTHMKTEFIKQFFFGFGDRNICVLRDGNIIGSTCVPQAKYSVLDYSNPLRRADNYFIPLLRGFRYGLIDANARSPIFVFRRDKFGQRAHMFEQALDSKFVDGGTIKESPVKVTFRKADGSLTDPSYTWSSNLHFEATSSLPFFDGESRNRNEIDPSTLNKSIFTQANLLETTLFTSES